MPQPYCNSLRYEGPCHPGGSPRLRPWLLVIGGHQECFLSGSSLFLRQPCLDEQPGRVCIPRCSPSHHRPKMAPVPPSCTARITVHQNVFYLRHKKCKIAEISNMSRPATVSAAMYNRGDGGAHPETPCAAYVQCVCDTDGTQTGGGEVRGANSRDKGSMVFVLKTTRRQQRMDPRLPPLLLHRAGPRALVSFFLFS